MSIVYFTLQIPFNHIDGNKLNNSISNLEWCTHQENSNHAELNGLYKHPKTSKNCSKYKGVTWNINKWLAQKGINGTRYRIGRFDTEEEAYQAYLNFTI